MSKHIIQMDFDIYGHPDLSMDELLEFVRIEAKRIKHILGPRARTAVIKRSINGFHLEFPFTAVSEEERDWILEGSIVDSGYKWWIRERNLSTLRITPKTIIKEIGGEPVGVKRIEDTPKVIEVVE